MIYILYGIVGFGLFATILMMTLERHYGNGVAVKSWQELSPELSQQIALDKRVACSLYA